MTVIKIGDNKAKYQTIAGRDINIGTVQNWGDLIDELERLNAEVKRAHEQGILNKKVAKGARSEIMQAVQQTKEKHPNQQAIVEHINGARALIEGVGAATGLVTGFIAATEAVQKFFTATQ